MSDSSHEVRELRYKVKQLSRCCGRQGDTIHLLRAELAECRDLNSKIDRGDLRRLGRVAAEQSAEIDTLKEKLAAAQGAAVE